MGLISRHHFCEALPRGCSRAVRPKARELACLVQRFSARPNRDGEPPAANTFSFSAAERCEHARSGRCEPAQGASARPNQLREGHRVTRLADLKSARNTMSSPVSLVRLVRDLAPPMSLKVPLASRTSKCGAHISQ